MMDITIAIDKLEKIGLDSVKAELLERGLRQEAVDKLQPILELSGDNAQKLMKLREVLAVSETGLKGIEEMETVLGYVERLGIGLDVELDLSLARGLNYYTGAIFEVKALDFAIGSICGGGRYDDLTGIFGHARHVGRGHFVRRRSDLRRNDGAGALPRGGQLLDAGILHQPRAGGAGRGARVAP